MKTFVEFQLSYCPLFSMFHSGSLNNKINNVDEKALRLVYFDYKSSFQELLDKDAFFSVHHRNIQTLAIEIYKHIHGLSPTFMGEVFKINRTLPYNLRTHNEFSSGVPKTVKYGTETISFLAPKVAALVPGKIKECSCLEAFKSKIRNWKPDCPCRLCKTYLQHVGFFEICTNVFLNTNAHLQKYFKHSPSRFFKVIGKSTENELLIILILQIWSLSRESKYSY